MDKKIVLVGAGSTSFGPSMLSDLYLSDILGGSTIVLHDIDEEKLEMIYELLIAENERVGNKYNLERTTNRAIAFKNADFIISSIEVGSRFDLWRQDYEIPKRHGSTQILGEVGGPGSFFHAARIIPPIIEIVKDAERICPNAFFINFSNPLSKVGLAIKRSTKRLKSISLCHQIHFLEFHLPKMFNKPLMQLRLKVAGLNHFGFLLGLEDIKSGKDLMPEFNAKALDYFKNKWDRWQFSDLTFEVYKRFGYFPYTGDNHLGEFLIFGEEFTKTQDMIDWINRTDQGGKAVYDRILRSYKRLNKGSYPKGGILAKIPSGERAINIIEAIIENRNSYENAVNIPNEGLIDNLPQDLIVEVPVHVNKDGVQGIKIALLPKNIAAILRIEASIQDVYVDAILNKSKDLALAAVAMDPNVGSFKMADEIFAEMMELQKEYLSYFK